LPNVSERDRQRWSTESADDAQIRDARHGMPGTKGNGYFFRKAFENGYIQTVLANPAFVAFQPGGTYEADCYFEGPPDGFVQPIGKDSSHRTESTTLGLGLIMATRYVVTAYPCDEPRSGGRPVPGSCTNR
jgi:hypothetical protein